MSIEATGYTAVPANILSAPTDTEGYQPTTSSTYPLQPLGQTTSQSAPPAYDSSKLLNYQVYCSCALVISTELLVCVALYISCCNAESTMNYV